jgi:hypothetical protein
VNGESEAVFSDFLEWAARYETWPGSAGRAAHADAFAAFAGDTARLTSRAEIAAYLASATRPE